MFWDSDLPLDVFGGLYLCSSSWCHWWFMFCICALPLGVIGSLCSVFVLFLLKTLVVYVLYLCSSSWCLWCLCSVFVLFSYVIDGLCSVFVLFLLVSLVGYVLGFCSSSWCQWLSMFCDCALPLDIVGDLCSVIVLFLLESLVGYVVWLCSTAWCLW